MTAVVDAHTPGSGHRGQAAEEWGLKKQAMPKYNKVSVVGEIGSGIYTLLGASITRSHGISLGFTIRGRNRAFHELCRDLVRLAQYFSTSREILFDDVRIVRGPTRASPTASSVVWTSDVLRDSVLRDLTRSTVI